MKYRPDVQDIKPDNLIRRSEDLLSDQDDEQRQHQHQIILKDRNLKSRMRSIISLAVILTDELEADMTQLSAIFYNLNEEESADEESLEEFSLRPTKLIE